MKRWPTIGFVCLAFGCSRQASAPVDAGSNAGMLAPISQAGRIAPAADGGGAGNAPALSGRGAGGGSGSLIQGGASGELRSAGRGGVSADAGVAGAGGEVGGQAGSAADGGCGADYDASHPPAKLSLTGNLGTHDPSIIEVAGQYYLFHTGPGLPMKHSSDLHAWQAAGSVFKTNPSWIAQKLSGVTDLWAPDISHFGGLYHVYYAASTSGSDHSCIGHATSTSVDGGFVDQGPVICSNDGTKDDWNAIDPNLVLDDAGKAHLVFGSFWGGIKLIDLDDRGARAGDTLTALAARPDAGGAIEAPYVVKRCGYYYLFTSFDRCCNGAMSTYNIRVGRATALAGPYVDQQGTAMLKGGGTLLVKGDSTWAGPGHNAVLIDESGAYNVYHAYYAAPSGSTYNTNASYLRISQIAWDASGWPVSAGP